MYSIRSLVTVFKLLLERQIVLIASLGLCKEPIYILSSNDRVNNYDMLGLMDRIGYVLVILKSY